ncbi:SHOCT domain-containing protein [Mycolicibacterium septicum]|nr:SHOCT domain-containing protein [Mycolicibacterium septicum]MDT0522374.1 SHOCT domain-containing protein [Streptomyces sp. DSM 41633]
MMFLYDHEMGWLGYAGMGIGMVLFWVLLIVGIITLIRFLTGDRQYPPPTQAQSAEQILAARFARGEISETEFRDRLAVLHGHQAPS